MARLLQRNVTQVQRVNDLVSEISAASTGSARAWTRADPLMLRRIADAISQRHAHRHALAPA